MNMIEERGQVVAVDGDFIVVQTQPRSSCSSCHVGSDCGTSVLARWFGQRTNRIRVHNSLNLRIGQGAVIGINESALLKASLIAYFMPMLAMVITAMVAEQWGANDGVVALSSLLGLGVGLLFLQRLGSSAKRRAYQTSLLRQEVRKKIRQAEDVTQSLNVANRF